jgi:hypothetical protein
VVLVFITPDKLDLWEALVTFALYFIMVLTAYRVDVAGHLKKVGMHICT